MDVATLLLAGAVAGTFAGLLGIGGGAVIVPVLSLVFINQGLGPDALVKTAIGSSLATIAVTALASIWTHHRKGAVRWPLAWTMTPGVVAGAIIGAAVADWIPGLVLGYVFVLFLTCVAAQMALDMREGVRPAGAGGERLPGVWGLRAVAMSVGAVSALMGIGGGALHVPYLSWRGVAVKQAIATAAAIGFPLGAVSAVGFIIAGLDESGLPPYNVGYVNLPAFGGIVAASVVFAPLGAKLAHALPDKLLKRIFAAFLLALAARMAYDLITGT